MDFVYGQLVNGSAFRVLIADAHLSFESMLLKTGFRLTCREIKLALNRVAQNRKYPAYITVDHGTKFTSLSMRDRAHVYSMSLTFQSQERQQTISFENSLMDDSEMNDKTCGSTNSWEN
jgi:putative transposase